MKVSMDTSQFKLSEANQAFKQGQKVKDFGFKNVGQISEKGSEFGFQDAGQKGGFVNFFA
jgi:hypothetical protein